MEDSRITRLRVNIAKLKLMLVKYIQEDFVYETSVHVYRNNHEIPRDQKHMERIYARTTSEEDTKSLGISVGDFVSFDPRTVITS